MNQNPSHRKSKKAMKTARRELALQAGYSPAEARRIAKRAVYRGDSRKFGPSREAKYRDLPPRATNPSFEMWTPDKRSVARFYSNDGRRWDVGIYGDKGNSQRLQSKRGVTLAYAEKWARKTLAARIKNPLPPDRISGITATIKKGKGGYYITFSNGAVASWFATKQQAKDYVTSGRAREVSIKSNPLPIGKTVTVKAIRRSNGRVELYRA